MSVSQRPVRRPNGLIALITAITVVPLATLLWLGWRLLEQDRVVERQQEQDRLDGAADLVTATLQRAIASSEQRVTEGAERWPSGAVAVVFHPDRVDAYPKNLAFRPYVPVLREPAPEAFAAGDALEFIKRDHRAAIESFRPLTASPDAAIRAGAWLRLAGSLATAARIEDALAAYQQLTSLDDVAVLGVPASLVGQFGRCQLLQREGRSTQLQMEAQKLADDLKSGRWQLTRSVYSLYADDVAKWAGLPSRNLESETLAEAADALWQQRSSLAPRGRMVMSIGNQTVVLLWQRSGGTLRALLAGPTFVESQWLNSARVVAAEQRVSFTLVSGAQAQPQTAIRAAKQTELPWDVIVKNRGAALHAEEYATRRRFLVAGFAVLVLMAVIAGYVIVRAVNREMAVARLQSDFVSAVSHEFRTPLTALRQFTDMLREHDESATDPGKERRLLSYDAQSRATDRLTKLVESLLDFGRIEAGVRRYQFECHECTDFVRGVVEDFRRTVPSGYDVRFGGNGSAHVDADPDALGRAIWNLLDNAVKYSPDHRLVEVGVRRDEDRIQIAVRDHGIGIAAHERDRIFAKFQRGEQARDRGITGTGIGLTMVDEIVKAHGGHVEVASELGTGSTFTIVLPLREAVG